MDLDTKLIPTLHTITWNPKEDITLHELAMCIPLFCRHPQLLRLPWFDGEDVFTIDKKNGVPYTRHFDVH